MKTLLYVSFLCASIALSPVQSFAADQKPPAPADGKTAAKPRAIPFRGKVAVVDKQAKTLKVGERVFQITSETKLVKAGKPATLDDAAVGDEVGGQYVTAEGGKLQALSVRLGPKPAEPEKK